MTAEFVFNTPVFSQDYSYQTNLLYSKPYIQIKYSSVEMKIWKYFVEYIFRRSKCRQIYNANNDFKVKFFSASYFTRNSNNVKKSRKV